MRIKHRPALPLSALENVVRADSIWTRLSCSWDHLAGLWGRTKVGVRVREWESGRKRSMKREGKGKRRKMDSHCEIQPTRPDPPAHGPNLTGPRVSIKLRPALTLTCWQYWNQCSRIRILRFFSDLKKHDFLRFFKWPVKKRKNVVSKNIVLSQSKWVHILRLVNLILSFWSLIHSD